MADMQTGVQPEEREKTGTDGVPFVGTLPPAFAQANIRPAAGGKTQQQDDDEIDLLKVLQAIRRKLLLIIFLGLLFGCAFAGVTKFFITPTYTSTSKMLVLTKETTISSLADLQLGSQLTKDYTILIQSRPVLTDVVDNLGLDMDYKVLLNKLSIANPADSRILEISITDPDPYLAKKIVDEVSYVAADYIGEKMEVTTPNIIEDGEIPFEKTSPNMRKNVLIGVLLGVLLGCAIAVISDLMNDAIFTEEDVEQYLGLITLASIPEKDQKKSGRRKRKKQKRAEAKRT